MPRSAENDLKEKILCAAIKLFAENGYTETTMRDIAKMINIKAGSIYNHFPSKRDILLRCYDFYIEQRRLLWPTPEDLMLTAETGSIQDVLKKLDYRWPASIENTMHSILTIAVGRANIDADSNRFIREQLFEDGKARWGPPLNRLIELGKMEPINLARFHTILAYFAFTAVLFSHDSIRLPLEDYNSCVAMVCSLLKPIPPK
jgi:AcrR family transcriptional regulator